MAARIVISIGDYNGIGPEVIIKALQGIDLQYMTPIILGSEKIIDYYISLTDGSLNYRSVSEMGEVEESTVNVFNCLDEEQIEIEPGTLSAAAGRYSMQAVERGIELCMNHEADALVTASISKEAVNRAGYEIPGHTEHLAQKTGVENPIMMLVNNGLRIGLCTTHIPLKEVPFQITEERIILMIRNMADSLNRDFGIDTPRLAVLGLNPHAGDGGTLGIEEQRIIAPAIDKARSGSVDIEGPFPADGLFGSRNYTQYDGILAMYHDQGLIPFKALSFGKGVNFTAGLPIIRTSPDHGTAFDIAGKNRANATSFKQALELAADLVRIRKSQPA